MKTLFTEEQRGALKEATLDERSAEHNPKEELATIAWLLNNMHIFKRHWLNFSTLFEHLETLDSLQHGVGDVVYRSDAIGSWRRHSWKGFSKLEEGVRSMEKLEKILRKQKKEIEGELQ